jgi:hypothetical protein
LVVISGAQGESPSYAVAPANVLALDSPTPGSATERM